MHPRLIDTLLTEIAGRCPENLSTDDVTVLVVRATGQQTRHWLSERVRAALRLVGRAIGSVRPGSERPPFPDLNAANLFGPVMPALERRWRRRHDG